MKKRDKKILLAVCCTGALALGSAGLAQAESPVILAGAGQTWEEAGGPGEQQKAEASDIKIWGPVLSAENGAISMDNQSGYSSAGEVILHIDPERSRVLDAVNGFPVEPSDIQTGEVIYAYIGPAMTMSLPPQTTAELVLCQIPADYKVPDYVQVREMQKQESGDWLLTAADGKIYPVPADCQILPYLTRNRVMLEDVREFSVCLIWSDETDTAQKIVLFASE